MSTSARKTVKTKFGTYFVPIKDEVQFLKEYSIMQQIDLLPSVRRSEFNKKWGKYKVTVLPPKRK